MMRSIALAFVVSCLCIVSTGCGGDVKVTQEEEEAFRNPPKGMPPEAAEAMAKSREEGMKRAAEAMRKSQQGGGR
ncbi:MAG TPA: hypothetical protein VM328_07605 [Fimbriimonadaceae bacterium]|nr:hypothetical protein [Fimbriimonadaceae bacterium]